MILSVFVVSLLTIFGSSTQETSTARFSCEQRPSGYYADLETGCQVYHMCDGLGRQFSYSCPNATLFQQRMLICDHWYMVNCSNSEVDYRANLLIGQRDKPFLEDSEKHPYHRTPRPDLLTNHKVPEYNFMYRNGRSQFASNFNLVGVETDNDHNGSSTTDRPSYSLPSHWFTEYSKTTTTKHEDKSFHVKQAKYTKIPDDANKKIVDETYKTKLKSVINENTKFNFQNKIEISTEAFLATFTGHYKDKPSVPSTTTGHLFTQNHFSPPTDTQYHNLHAQTLDSNLHTNNYFNARAIPKKTLVQETRSHEMNWKDLRKLFLIPDYEFPLDSASRPGYENGQSSFEVNSTLPDFYKK